MLQKRVRYSSPKAYHIFTGAYLSGGKANAGGSYSRKFPCFNCLKSRAKCVPATLAPRQRRRQFPERELLESLRKYEDLLRQNNIKFEPFYNDMNGEEEPSSTKSVDGFVNEQPEAAGASGPSSSTAVKHERANEAKYVLSKKMTSHY